MSTSSTLKRHLGFWDIIMFGIGGIVGAGIYAIIGEAGGLAGNMLWLSFAIAAVVALLTGLTYAEFVSLFPDSGGSFEYVKQGFGQKIALILSVFMLFTGIVAAAAIAISFSDYLTRLLDVPNWTSTLGILILMSLLNIVGIQQASWFNTLATIVTLAGLAAVVIFAIPAWGSTPLLESPPKGTTGILSGTALIFFSFVGFEDLVKMAEETKEPEKNMPRGILISGVAVLLIYILIAVSAVSILDWKELSERNGPLAAVMETVAGKTWANILIGVALFATSKTILSNILGTSRLVYDVARDSKANWMKKLTSVAKATGTPIFSIIAITALAIVFGLIGNLKVVASISNVLIFLVFLMVNFAMISYRINHEKAKDAPFRIPLNINNIPIPTVIAIVGLLILLGFNIYNIFTGIG
ncbi:MAG: amino acid permease [Bacteroidota bacterium]